MKPMLCRPIANPDELVDNLLWSASQKLDGRRALFVMPTGESTFRHYNRRGEPAYGLPKLVATELNKVLGTGIVLDGEIVGTGPEATFYAFDLVEAGKVVATTTPWKKRQAALGVLFDRWQPGPAVKMLPFADTTKHKRSLLHEVETKDLEGLVMKEVHSVYAPGARSSSWLKWKRWNEASFVATALGVDGRSSVELSLYDDDGDLVPVGSASTLEGDGPRLALGSVIDCRYLHCGKPDDPRLTQPHLRRLRSDVHPSECSMSALSGFHNEEIVDV